MAQEFCEHLDEYGVLFGRAQASYENCLHLVDKIIEDMDQPELRRTLESALDEWVGETRRMQESFVDLVNNGSIDVVVQPELPPGNQNADPIPLCCDCNFRIPRLHFPEFDLIDEDKPKYRGRELPLPVGNEA